MIAWCCLAHGSQPLVLMYPPAGGCSLLCVRPECRAPVPGQASGRGASDQYEGWGHQEAIQHQPCHVLPIPPTCGHCVWIIERIRPWITRLSRPVIFTTFFTVIYFYGYVFLGSIWLLSKVSSSSTLRHTNSMPVLPERALLITQVGHYTKQGSKLINLTCRGWRRCRSAACCKSEGYNILDEGSEEDSMDFHQCNGSWSRLLMISLEGEHFWLSDPVLSILWYFRSSCPRMLGSGRQGISTTASLTPYIGWG